MFCPKCATQNLEGASYCRSCGANISLIPHALSGQLPQAVEDDEIVNGRHRRRRDRSKPSLDHACKNVFMGIAFLLVSIALAFSRMGRGWWFWMLIPAFSMMGSGVAQYIRIRQREKRSLPVEASARPSTLRQPGADAFPTRNTGELMAPPPSVTEGTTRHLGAEAPTRHFETPK